MVRHSFSCIVMQCAENYTGRISSYCPGKTCLFAVFAAEPFSARFCGARKGCYGKYLRASGTKKAPEGSQSFDSETVTFSVRSDNQLPFDCLLLTVLMMVLRRERVAAVTGDLFSADGTSINSRMGNAVSWIIS